MPSTSAATLKFSVPRYTMRPGDGKRWPDIQEKVSSISRHSHCDYDLGTFIR
jgi:hypothetical protein